MPRRMAGSSIPLGVRRCRWTSTHARCATRMPSRQPTPERRRAACPVPHAGPGVHRGQSKAQPSQSRHVTTCHGQAWCTHWRVCACVCALLLRAACLSVCSLPPVACPLRSFSPSRPLKTGGGTGGKGKERTEKPRTHAAHRQGKHRGKETRIGRSTVKESCPALWPRPFAT
jgi:hypothetical protein